MNLISNRPGGTDLRSFLSFLESSHPEQVLRVSREVDPDFGVSGILHRLERDGHFRVVIFEKVKGSGMPLVSNMHADFERLRLALGMVEGDEKAFLAEYGAREAAPIAPVIVDDGPVQEVVRTGDEVNLGELPICTYHELDAGRYITAGLGLMRDPETGIENIGIYRHMVHGRNELGIQLSETAHGHIIWQKYEARGEPCPIAIIIGHHPAFFLGALSFSPMEANELHIAGGVRQSPVELVPCRTIPLAVPADAEIVLECEIRPVERRPEAPFGEYPGTYGPERLNPVLEVKAVTHRRDPLYQDAFVGHADHLLLAGIIRASAIERTVRIACPTVTRVRVSRAGSYRFVCYIAIDRRIEGEAKQAAMAAFVADPFLKFAVVVDKDVDVASDTEVMHAIGTRVRADRDVFMVPHAKGSPLDPASYDPEGGSHLVTKMGIDATRKDDYPAEISVPGADGIDLAEFIDGYAGPGRDGLS